MLLTGNPDVMPVTLGMYIVKIITVPLFNNNKRTYPSGGVLWGSCCQPIMLAL